MTVTVAFSEPGPDPRREPPQHLLHGTVVSDGRIIPDAVVAYTGDCIDYAGPSTAFRPATGAVTLPTPKNAFLLPGLIDVHNHGAVAGDFSRADPATARDAIDFWHRQGTTTLVASLVTTAESALLTALNLYRDWVAEGLLAGIHLEGPFLSTIRCGAQDPAYIREPDLELAARLLDAGGLATGRNSIRTMTYAPELPGSQELVDLLVDASIVPSLGHSDADAATTEASLRYLSERLSLMNSRPTVTHLFNGMPPFHHRSPGPAAASLRLARQGLAAVELIADNVHGSPETTRFVFELVGAANVLLITDSMAATGLPDGDYELGPAHVTVKDRVARLTEGSSLAGGTATLLDVVQRTYEAGVPLAEAALSATAVPAQLLGLAQEIGKLQPGFTADILITDAALNLTYVIRRGERLEPWAT